MSDRLLKESDVIEAFKGREPLIHDVYTATAIIRSIPSADTSECTCCEYRVGDLCCYSDVDIKPDRSQHWIPCSERLPEDSGDYLVCPSDSVLEDYSDFSEVMIMPYDADCEAFGYWVERYHPISLGYLDSDFNEFEVLAWMPLPEPWKGEGDE